MELRQIRYFIAVAEELSFTRAAVRCRISQPPLSRQIVQLENEVGAKLLLRDKHSVSLTEAGQSFLHDARRIQLAADTAAERARHAAAGLVGRLVLGFGSTAAFALLPKLVRGYRRRHPDVELVLRSLPVVGQIKALRDGEIDVGLIRLPVHDETIETTLVWRDPLVVALPEDHPLAARRRVPLAQLRGSPFVAYQRTLGLGFHNDLLAVCHAAGFNPRIVHETAPTAAVLAIVACGEGVAIVPASASRLHMPGVSYRPLTMPRGAAPATTVVELGVAWLRQRISATTFGFVADAKSLAGANS